MITHYYTERRSVPIGDKCPLCKTGNTVVRVNSSTKVEFVGCERFPACKFSANSVQAERERKRRLSYLSIAYITGPDGEPVDALREY